MGHWEDRKPGYLAFNVVNCAYCGKMIPRRRWVELVAGQLLMFCGPHCLDRYLRRHAAAGRPDVVS